MSSFTDEQIKQLIKEKNLKTAADVQDMLKDMFGKTLEHMLEARDGKRTWLLKIQLQGQKDRQLQKRPHQKERTLDLGELDLAYPGTETVTLNRW